MPQTATNSFVTCALWRLTMLSTVGFGGGHKIGHSRTTPRLGIPWQTALNRRMQLAANLADTDNDIVLILFRNNAGFLIHARI